MQSLDDQDRFAHQNIVHFLQSTGQFITFCVSRRRRKMYCGHARLCVCVCVHGYTPTVLHGPGCNLGAW